MSYLRGQHTEIGGLVPVINPKYDPEAESPMGRKKDFPAEKYPNYQ